jgi:hypothetical protein
VNETRDEQRNGHARAMRASSVAILACLLLIVGCPASPSPDETRQRPERASEGEGEGEGEGEAAADAPRILSFTSNTARLTPFGNIQFSVVVTDPDGIDDVIGGILVDPASGSTYATFATAAAEGAYSATIDWDGVNVVRPIDFTSPTSRTLRASFFDVAGHVTSSETTVQLSCDGRSEACAGVCGRLRCGDVCVNPDADNDNCGACNNACPGDTICSAAPPNAAVCECPSFVPDQCGNTCVDVARDLENCGACGVPCEFGCFCSFEPARAASSCRDGACLVDTGRCRNTCSNDGGAVGGERDGFVAGASCGSEPAQCASHACTCADGEAIDVSGCLFGQCTSAAECQTECCSLGHCD